MSAEPPAETAQLTKHPRTPFANFLRRTPLPEMAAEVRAYVKATPAKTFLALMLAPILITLTMRLASVPNAHDVLRRVTGREPELLLCWYGVFCLQIVLLYVIPALCVKLVYKENLRDYGHQLRPVAKLWPLILLFLLIMIPVTYLSSRQPAFRTFYPLYPGSYKGWGPFLVFEAGIFSLFFTQEFFFRGFIIESLKPQFGNSAILISTAMYGIAHYSKPLPEQLGAFFVGILLGYLGDRYRTFYFGIVVHYLIAFAMDAFLVVPALLKGTAH
jgi:uncharacterized protein